VLDTSSLFKFNIIYLWNLELLCYDVIIKWIGYDGIVYHWNCKVDLDMMTLYIDKFVNLDWTQQDNVYRWNEHGKCLEWNEMMCQKCYEIVKLNMWKVWNDT